MKARMKRILSVVLALAMTAALVSMSAFALGTTDFALNAAAEVTVDGTADQTVNVVFSANSAMSVIALQGTFSTTETEGTGYLTLSDYVSPVALAGTNFFSTSSGRTVYADLANLEGFAVEAGGNVMTAVYTVDKDTPAGTYTVEFNVVDVQDYDFNTVSNQVYTATVNVTHQEQAPESGYGVTLSTNAPADGVTKDDSVAVYLDVSHKTAATFNSFDGTLTYDSALFTYAGCSEGFDVTDNNGTLTITAYGGDKNITSAHELTLNFTAKQVAAEASGSFTLSAVADMAAHANENAETVTVYGSPLSVSVNPPVVTYSVTITLGSNMTSSGALSQTGLTGAMTDVTVTADEGYTLAAPTVTGSGVTAAANADGSYTVSGTPTADVTVTFADATEKIPVVTPETSTAYLDGYTLIKATITDANGKVPTYDGNAMYQIENVSGQTAYDETAYYYIVKTTEYDSAKVGYAAVTAETIAKDGDANQTGVIDINDAQFIYNLYNNVTVPYMPTVAQLLASDVNGDGAVLTDDCAAVVPLIP